MQVIPAATYRPGEPPVVALHGEIDVANRDQVLALIATTGASIVDMAEVSFIDPTTYDAISIDPHVSIANPSQRVRRLADILGHI